MSSFTNPMPHRLWYGVNKFFVLLMLCSFITTAYGQDPIQPKKDKPKVAEKTYPKTTFILPGFAKTLQFGMTKDEVRAATAIKLLDTKDGNLEFDGSEIDEDDFKNQKVNYFLGFTFDKNERLIKVEAQCSHVTMDGCLEGNKLYGFYDTLTKQLGKPKRRVLKKETTQLTWINGDIKWIYEIYVGTESGDTDERYVITIK